MTNNDIFCRICNTFDLNDSAVIDICALADFNATQPQVAAWLKNEDGITDIQLAQFLNGFINLKRGKRDGEQPKPEEHLNNNMIFQKLRIALNLKAEDVLDILQGVDVHLSKHELSAFFRKFGNKHYKECSDRLLQSFLQGVQTQAIS